MGMQQQTGIANIASGFMQGKQQAGKDAQAQEFKALQLKELKTKQKWQEEFFNLYGHAPEDAGAGGAYPQRGAGGEVMKPQDYGQPEPEMDVAGLIARAQQDPMFSSLFQNATGIKMPTPKPQQPMKAGPDVLFTQDGKVSGRAEGVIPTKSEAFSTFVEGVGDVQGRIDPYTGDVTIPGWGKTGQDFFVKKPEMTETYTETREDGTVVEGKRVKQSGIKLPGTEVVKTPPKGSTPEQAGKIQGGAKAEVLIDELTASLIKPDGSVNRKLIWQMNAPFGGVYEGRESYAKFLEAMDVKVRAMTGAAINQEEIPFYESIYKPHYLDSDSTIKNKMKRFKEFAIGYSIALDPQGATKKKIDVAGGLGNKPTPKGPGKKEPTASERLRERFDKGGQ